MFKIGEFSKLVRVSPRMLRHYEKCGLFCPAEIDRYTGYRQYSAKQIPLVSNIAKLRDLGFSIEEIADILPHMNDYPYMGRVLRTKASSMQAAIDAQQEKLERLIEMSNTMQKERNIMIFNIELKSIPAVKVISLRGIIPKYNQEGILWEKLGKYIGEKGIACHNDGYSTYYDDAYQDENPDVEIAIPVDTIGESEGDFIFKEYEAIPLAATLSFTGPFDGGYDAAFEKLAQWMEEHGYAFAGNIRGHAIPASEGEPNNEKHWTTELQVPVMKNKE